MPKANLTREQADHQHLTRVRRLTAEVSAAISAIEHSDLRQLQVAIANQERICHELATTKWTLPTLVKAPASALAAIHSETGKQIQAAYVALAQINRVYAGVVKRSKRSVDLLSALYRDQADGYGQEPVQSDKFQTLSCEA